VVFKTNLIIFGGINTENFCPSELYVLEMDPTYAKRFQADEYRKRQLEKKKEEEQAK